MTDEKTFEALEQVVPHVDPGGVIDAMAADAFGLTRRDLLRGTFAAAAAAGLGALVVADDANSSVAQTADDIAILRFDQVLEFLQSGLYTEAERLGALAPKTLAWARVVGAHERAHLRAIENLLGRHVVKNPGFDYGSVTSDENAFVKTAVAFEDLTAALLKWQAPRLDSRRVVAAVVSLHSVETRHAAWIRHLVGLRPATTPFDKPASQQKMARLIQSTHFVVARPSTAAKTKPRYTG